MSKMIRAIFGVVALTSLGVAALPADAMPGSSLSTIEGVTSNLIQQARTYCRPDGQCFNTSGRPIYQRRVYRPYNRKYDRPRYYQRRGW